MSFPEMCFLIVSKPLSEGHHCEGVLPTSESLSQDSLEETAIEPRLVANPRSKSPAMLEMIIPKKRIRATEEVMEST